MYRPVYFEPEELVPPEVFELHGEESYKLFDDHVLKMLDNFRCQFDSPLMINNYRLGYTESGYRTVGTKTGAKRSSHKFACAFDLKTHNMPALRQFIKERGADFYIWRVEKFDKTVGKHQDWCHVQFGFEPTKDIYYFNP